MPISSKRRNPEEVSIGTVYNKWTVLTGPTKEKYPSQRKWLCRCECGKEYWVRGNDLVSGKSPRCRGCGFRGTPMQVQLGISHALCRRLRKAARSAIYRCTNPADQAYHNYGGRGVVVYGPWVDDVKLFVAYLLTLPGHDDSSLVLDRTENNKGYEPGNLRFVTWSVSNSNQRRYIGGKTEGVG